MKIVAIVPLKFDNKRLPGKNKKILAGKELYCWILRALGQCSLIDSIYIYTSSVHEISQPLLVKNHIEVLERDTRLDSDSTNFSEIFLSFFDTVKADIYVYAHATAPFLRPLTISKCIKNVLSGRFDSSYTAIQEKDYFWYKEKPLTYDPTAPLPRSQDLKPLTRETSGVYAFTKELFEQQRTRISVNSAPVFVNRVEAIDINEEYDFIVAQAFQNMLETVS